MSPWTWLKLSHTTPSPPQVVFSKDGSYAQELIVDELVAATDAMSREALSEALRLVLGSASAVSALRSMEVRPCSAPGACEVHACEVQLGGGGVA